MVPFLFARKKKPDHRSGGKFPHEVASAEILNPVFIQVCTV